MLRVKRLFRGRARRHRLRMFQIPLGQDIPATVAEPLRFTASAMRKGRRVLSPVSRWWTVRAVSVVVDGGMRVCRRRCGGPVGTVDACQIVKRAPEIALGHRIHARARSRRRAEPGDCQQGQEDACEWPARSSNPSHDLPRDCLESCSTQAVYSGSIPPTAPRRNLPVEGSFGNCDRRLFRFTVPSTPDTRSWFSDRTHDFGNFARQVAERQRLAEIVHS
jgi:hypothetical protein